MRSRKHCATALTAEGERTSAVRCSPDRKTRCERQRVARSQAGPGSTKAGGRRSRYQCARLRERTMMVAQHKGRPRENRRVGWRRLASHSASSHRGSRPGMVGQRGPAPKRGLISITWMPRPLEEKLDGDQPTQSARARTTRTTVALILVPHGRDLVTRPRPRPEPGNHAAGPAVITAYTSACTPPRPRALLDGIGHAADAGPQVLFVAHHHVALARVPRRGLRKQGTGARWLQELLGSQVCGTARPGR